MNLRIDLSVIMHQDLVKDIAFFEKKQDRFIAFIGPYLRPIKVGKNEYIVKEGEYAHEMYFIKTGKVSLVLRNFNNFRFLEIS